MRQVHSYYNGTGFNAPAALNRDLVEIQLIEEFHWLPQDIANIPYKWLQKFFLLRKQKRVTIDEKRKIDAFKNQSKPQPMRGGMSRGRGQTRRK